MKKYLLLIVLMCVCVLNAKKLYVGTGLGFDYIRIGLKFLQDEGGLSFKEDLTGSIYDCYIGPNFIINP